MESLQPFRHVLVIEDQKARRIVVLEQSTYSVGRESSNDIVIYDRIVSRHHATLLRIKKSPRHDSYFYRIIDGDLEGNKSTNGLIINGKRCESHNLKHGDVILLGNKAKLSYYILSNAIDIALFNPIESAKVESLSEATISWSDNCKSTAIESEKLEQFDRDDLMRLASFPELSPNPIIEIDYEGNLTYLNPAASIKFSNMQRASLEHPILMGLLAQAPNVEGNLLLREVKVGEEVYEQYVHFLSENKLIRSYLFDVTERKRAQENLQYQAFHDSLTNLPNRAFFNEQLAIALANAKRNRNLMAVMFLDLDGFKNINDTLGHTIGDRLLQSFAKRLSACLRGGDTLARWGGDEFTILLPQIRSAEDTIKLAQRILNELKLPFEISENQIYIKSSIGIALYPQDGQDAETLVKRADVALYRAKEQGRDRYRFYSSSMASKASLLLKLEGLLRQALNKNELSLHYQPQANVKTNALTGMEALLRWSHPELGQVSPVKLIPLAEETDLIVPLSEWVLQTACKQNRLWQEAGLQLVPVAVNFSLRQFHQLNFVKMVMRTLEETKLEPQWLEIEITEAAIAHNSDYALQTLQALHQIGIRFALDDFGTGQASLNYLQKFSFHTLKIDRSLIQILKDNPQDSAMVRAIVASGRSFNLRIVAEGVENLQQFEILQRLQCEEVQGYWFSRPLKPEDATQFLVHSRVEA
ncbi:MAG: EAL domain-containing protein [Hydrococcus sp. C42_A2020_068]|uniref:EAL domain-containing protein n=1 Tax=Pleurocapsa sp. PCC 7327 TaxID=118163 RepID=UPI00029FC54F|nr:EAL domain-containing protein [Pleurocapsa sp. PCC 7327]AFY78941.1 diguanylate cyclase (GGDEF) domain-containing protein [Pleurocapsa sp. PCC 7327]MBF2019838.1 EAL domain-containing protein [Hydrococcus sp. C42_A2020_068]